MMVACETISEGELHEGSENAVVLGVGTRSQMESLYEEQVADGTYPEMFLLKVKARGFASVTFDIDEDESESNEHAVPILRTS